MRQTGLRETIIRASNPATMMERVLAGALVLVPSADGAVIGLCTDVASVVFAAASGKMADSVGSVLSIESSLSASRSRVASLSAANTLRVTRASTWCSQPKSALCR